MTAKQRESALIAASAEGWRSARALPSELLKAQLQRGELHSPTQSMQQPTPRPAPVAAQLPPSEVVAAVTVRVTEGSGR